MRSPSSSARSRRARKRSICPRLRAARESRPAEKRAPIPPSAYLAARRSSARVARKTTTAPRRATTPQAHSSATRRTIAPTTRAPLMMRNGSGGQSRSPGGRTAVSPSTASGLPHSGQKRLPPGTALPQLGQSGRGVHPLRRPCDERAGRLERLERLGGLAPERADELVVVRVCDLSSAVVELELLQRRERTVAPLEELQALLLGGRARREPIVGRFGLRQELARHEGDAGDGEERGEK